jgi:hypothetical protein
MNASSSSNRAAGRGNRNYAAPNVILLDKIVSRLGEQYGYRVPLTLTSAGSP